MYDEIVCRMMKGFQTILADLLEAETVDNVFASDGRQAAPLVARTLSEEISAGGF